MPITLSMARVKQPAILSTERFPSVYPVSGEPAPLSLTDHLQRIQHYGARQHFQRNETIFNQGDAADQVYKVLSGTIRLCRYMPDGRRYIVDFLLPGDLTGFVESSEQPVSAEAVTEVTLIAYPRACFEKLAQQSAAVRDQLLSHLSSTLLDAHQHMFMLGCQKAKERLVTFLVRLADKLDLTYGDRLDLPMSRQDIADHLGLTIETISRSITALRNEGAILVPNAHQLILRDMVALRALAAEG